MANKCYRCKCKLTENNTKWNGYDGDKYGNVSPICDRCAWLEEKYQNEKFQGEFDENT